MIPKPFVFADLGCGDGKKSVHFIEEYLKDYPLLTFVPLDVSEGLSYYKWFLLF